MTAVTIAEPAAAVTCTSDMFTAAVAATDAAIDCSVEEETREMSSDRVSVIFTLCSIRNIVPGE